MKKTQTHIKANNRPTVVDIRCLEDRQDIREIKAIPYYNMTEEFKLSCHFNESRAHKPKPKAAERHKRCENVLRASDWPKDFPLNE